MFRAGRFGTLLRGYRVAANLTQEELAERSGVSIEAIGALERGSRRSPRPSTVAFLVAALNLDARQSESLAAAARGRPIQSELPGELTWPVPDERTHLRGAQALLRSMPTATLARRGPLPAGSRMPLAPNPLFVGRGDALRRIAVTLRAGRALALSQLVASTGLGGLGKTQLAVEFAHRYGRYFSGGVYWLSFASPREVPRQVAACAGPAAMDLAPGIDSLPLEERVQRVQRAWQSPEPRLLVFDSCEEEALLCRWRPTTGGCRVLVTSRRGHWSPTLGVTVLPLDVLSRHDSIELLRRYRPDLEPGGPGLDRVAHALGDLPLALHLAGSYLCAYRPEVDLEGYLAELRRPAALQHASLLGEGLDDSLSPTRHVQSVAGTFGPCLGRLDERNEADRIAIALLARLACMAPGEAVRRELLAGTLDDVDPLARANGLRRLGAVGLVEEGDGWLRLHRLLVQFVRQEDLDPRAQMAVDDALIGCAEAALHRELVGSALAASIPHLVDAAASGFRDASLTARLCRAAGVALQLSGDVRAATGWLERALEIREGMLGRDHPDVAQSIHDLAGQHMAMGDPQTARAMHEQALSIRRRVLEPDHQEIIESTNDLGVVLWHLGAPTAARPLLEWALAAYERTLGPDHPHSAASLSNLARVLQSLGDLGAAAPLLGRALRITEQALGPDHPHTASALTGLALLHRARGDLDAARLVAERAVAARERVLGPDHPDTATSLGDLAVVLQARGERNRAADLFRRVLAIRERALGPGHPDTITTRGSLATRPDAGDGDAPPEGPQAP